MTLTIEKEWNGNESVREGRNGRTYVSLGRWEWLVVADGAVDSVHTRKRDAKERVAEIAAPIVTTRTRTVSEAVYDKFVAAHARVIERIDEKGETVAEAAEAVYPDYGGPRFRDDLVRFATGRLLLNYRPTLAEARATLRALGLTIRKRDGEYRVAFRSQGTMIATVEETAYYTTDLADAISTGRYMALEWAYDQRTTPTTPRATSANAAAFYAAHATPPVYDVRPCYLCAAVGRVTECSTHPDAANPLAPCQDCGMVTCLDHRVEDAADRCNVCAALFYGVNGGGR